MRRLLAATAASFLVTAIAVDASANATLNNNLGGIGTLGYGANCMPANDDGSWPQDATGLDITAAFPGGLSFYRTAPYTHFWINTNGNISFAGGVPTFTPTNTFPGSSFPIIAAYWADVDTRQSNGPGSGVGAGGTFSAGDTCTNDYGANGPASDGIWWDLRPGQITITWDRVGYYSEHMDKLMSFQMILSANSCGAIGGDGGTGTNFDIEFRYRDCGWETGDASGGIGGFGGTQAVAGFDSGDGTHAATIPGSRAAGISTALCTGSNLTPPQSGVWRWSVQGGQISCPTAGQPCTVPGGKGICAQGQIQCPGTSAPTCVAINMPQPTKCNGLDNNCDGVTDNGPCPQNEVCVGASCVPGCVEGGCPTGQTCSSTTNGKVCVDTACVGVTCPNDEAGVPERCVHGQCVGICSGIVCPLGQVCRVGSCVDPCAGLNCGTGQVCENGACVPTCPCRACNANQTCQRNGACVATPCANKNCATGQVCEVMGTAGSCVDACTGAVCPQGQTCKTGQCVALPPAADAGSDSGIIVPPMDMDGGSVDGSMGGDAGDDAGSNDFGSGSKSGCGCRTASGGDDNALALTIGVGLAALFVGRRKRRK